MRALQLPQRMQLETGELIVIPTPEETQISSLKSGGTERAPASLPQAIVLSEEVVLLYVLARSESPAGRLLQRSALGVIGCNDSEDL
jgi:hypothetical protein